MPQGWWQTTIPRASSPLGSRAAGLTSAQRSLYSWQRLWVTWVACPSGLGSKNAGICRRSAAVQINRRRSTGPYVPAPCRRMTGLGRGAIQGTATRASARRLVLAEMPHVP